MFHRVSVAEQGSQQYVRALLSLFSNRSGQITVRPARSHAAGFVCGRVVLVYPEAAARKEKRKKSADATSAAPALPEKRTQISLRYLRPSVPPKGQLLLRRFLLLFAAWVAGKEQKTPPPPPPPPPPPAATLFGPLPPFVAGRGVTRGWFLVEDHWYPFNRSPCYRRRYDSARMLRLGWFLLCRSLLFHAPPCPS